MIGTFDRSNKNAIIHGIEENCYVVVTAESYTDLVSEVSTLIYQGWQPQGGVIQITGPHLAAQAMIKMDFKVS